MQQDRRAECSLGAGVDCNGQGIALLQLRNFPQAIDCFHHGLTEVFSPELCQAEAAVLGIATKSSLDVEVARSCKSVNGNFDTMCSQHHDCTPVKTCVSRIRPIYSVPFRGNATMPSGANDTFDMFDRALHVSFTSDELPRNPEILATLMSGILMYNLGLAHHFEGLRTGDSTYLTKGMEFYLIAYRIHRGLSEWPEIQSSLMQLCLSACLNNVGHIYAHFRRFVETGICCTELAGRLSASRSPTGQPSIDQEEGKLFYLNISLFEIASKIPAPAA